MTVGFNRRFDASHQQLRREIEAGVIGKIELVQMVCRASIMPPLEYLRSSGGQMRDGRFTSLTCCAFLPVMK